MMSRSTLRVSPLAVWLLVVVMLCAALAPGVAVAKLNRTIDTEGDPGTGWEAQGSSGSGSNSSDQDLNSISLPEEYRTPDNCWVIGQKDRCWVVIVFVGPAGVVALISVETRGSF